MADSRATYDYTDGNRLFDRLRYSYSPSTGYDFVDAWQTSRASVLAEMPTPGEPLPPIECEHPISGTFALADLLGWLRFRLSAANVPEAELFRLVYKFETTKRFYTAYDEHWRAASDNFQELEIYVQVAELFCAWYETAAPIQTLNALLKLNDTLISVRDDLSVSQQRRLARCVQAELAFVRQLEVGS